MNQPIANARRTPVVPALRSTARVASALAVAVVAILAGALLGQRGGAPAAAQAPAAPMRSGDVGQVVALPLIAAAADGEAACTPRVTVQSLGDRPARGIVVVWDAAGTCQACAGPARAVCTGLIGPGSSWSLGPAELGPSARSAMVLGWAGDEAMCAALTSALAADCAAWPALLRAYGAGEPFAGHATAGAAAPIAATVDRVCPGGRGGGGSHAAYGGAARRAIEVVEPPETMELALPVLTTGYPGIADAAWVQNTGTTCATVVLHVKVQDDAVRAVGCLPLTLAPGETARIDLTACDVVGTRTYAAWLEADGPIAAVVERRQGGARALWPASELPSDAATRASTLYAPLARAEHQGWDTIVYAFNADAATAVKVKVFFLDAEGAIRTTLVDWIPGRSIQAFFMPLVQTLDGMTTGSVRIETQPNADGGEPPPSSLVGAVVMTRWAETSRHTVLAAMGDALLPGDQALLAPDGAGPGGLSSGAGLLAVPELVRHAVAGRVESSALVIANLVEAPGHTNVALSFYDANGLLDVLCTSLAAKTVQRRDLSVMGFLNDGFRGSAVISAIHWSHEVVDANGGVTRDLVGLAAAVERTDGAVADAGGDALALVGAVPLAGADRALLAPQLAQPCQLPTPGPATSTPQPTVSTGPPTLTPTITHPPTPPGPTPTPDPDPARRHEAIAWVPRMAGDEAGCVPSVQVSSAAGEPIKAVIVAWGVPGACAPQAEGPLKVECSGLIRPGGAWTFSGPQIPTGTRSALVLGVTTKMRSAIGLLDPPDDVVADAFCESLFFGIVGDAADYARLRAAIDAGTDFAGLPMDRVLSGPIVVTTETRCLRNADDPTSRPLVDTVLAPSGAQLGAPDAASGRWRYDLPLLHDSPIGDVPWPLSEVWLQNASAECATAIIRWRGHGDCGTPQSQTLDIAPGESAAFFPLLTRDNWGGGWIESTQPLAVSVLVDRTTGRAVYTAPASGGGLPGSDHVAYAPLVYHWHRGWTTVLHVQNRSTTTEARVRVELADRSGDVVAERIQAICPNSTVALPLGALSDVPGSWVGSVRLVSTRWFSASDPEAELPAITGVVELTRGPAGADEADVSETAIYPLLGATAGFVPPQDGDPASQATVEGAKLLALGGIVKAGGRETATSALAISNLVTKPGFTDLVLYFYDQNGLIDYVCQKLGARQTEFIDLTTWGYINPGFRGSALVSAWFWEHDAFDAQGNFLSNHVGLGAVVLQQPGRTVDGTSERDLDAVGDLSSAWLGMPIVLGDAAHGGSLPPEVVLTPLLCGGGPRPSETDTPAPPRTNRIFFGAMANQAPIVPADLPASTPSDLPPPVETATPEVTETSQPTRTPMPTRTPIAYEDLAPSVVHVPAILNLGDDEACAPTLSIKSVGDEPSKATLVVWGAPGSCPPEAEGPLKVECTGLLRPGAAWHLTGPSIPLGSRSGAVFSFNVRRLSQIGVSGMDDDIVADYLCENLFFGVVGDAEDYRRFRQAYLTGETHFDVPMSRVYGAPLAVDVHRDCAVGSGEDGAPVAASYRGVPLEGLGGAAEGHWTYAVGALGGDGAERTLVYLQNAGTECATVALTATAAGACMPDELAQVAEIAPGEAAVVELAGGAGPYDAAWAESTQPLAVVVDHVAEEDAAWLTSRGTVAQTAPGGAPGGDEAWYAPLTYSEQQGWSTTVSVQNLDGSQPAKVQVTFVDRDGTAIARFVDWICAGGGRRFILPLAETESGHRVGSARVESQEIELDGMRYPPRRVSASLQAKRLDQPAGQGTVQQAIAYHLVPAAEVRGKARYAIPMVVKRHGDGVPGLDASTELIVGNAVDGAGYTDVAVYFFDINGMIDYVCLRIPGGATESVDLATWGFLNHGYVGTGIVSASHWTHAGGAVGLVGASARRQRGDIGDSTAGDELAAEPSWPLDQPLPIDLGLATCPQTNPVRTITPSLPATSTPPSLPTETPALPSTPTPAHLPTAPPMPTPTALIGSRPNGSTVGHGERTTP